MTGIECKPADKNFLERQRNVLRLFKHIYQPTFYNDLTEIAKSFKFEGCWDQWTKPEFAKDFWRFYQDGDFVKKDEIFSIFHPQHLKCTIALFRALFYVKDFEILYKLATWARQNVNPDMFVYTFSIVILHSKLTEGILLPPIYEIFPHYFFTAEVITKAKQYKQQYKHGEKSAYVISADYTEFQEESITYFTEDINMNAHYYNKSIFVPFWLEKECNKYDAEKCGEWFHYYHTQILARYYMERLSNGRGVIPSINYEEPTLFSFNPNMAYFNGIPFPGRPKSVKFEETEQFSCFTKMQDFERRIRDALDLGWVYTPEGKVVHLYTEKGLEILGRMVENQPTSPHVRFYGCLQMVTRHVLGYSQNIAVPSILEQYQTSMRDPIFFQFVKRMMTYFQEHQRRMGPYKRTYLLEEGIKVDDIQVDKLVTFFEPVKTNITNAVTINEQDFLENSFQVYAEQSRLNHKPYNYKIHVTSDKAMEAFIKTFIGPKYDEFGNTIEMKDNYMNFFELDRFRYNLKPGKNVIDRNCRDTIYFADKYLTFADFENKINGAMDGSETFSIDLPHANYCFPQSLMLPKGDAIGKTYQFFVMITRYQMPPTDLFSRLVIDIRHPLGYPLDRPIEFENEFWVPNFYGKDVKIYHEESTDDKKY